MRSRPFAVVLAEVALCVLAVAGMVQAVRFGAMLPLVEMHWALPAGIAVIAGAVLVGLHQRRALARPLAMALFAALAIRGSLSLSSAGLHGALSNDAVGLTAVGFVAGALALAAWFALSSSAARDLSRP